MQNSVISNRITSIYGSQPSFVAFARKTATIGPELQVSTGSRFSAFSTAPLWTELIVSMGPSPHLRFLHSKQRPFDQTSPVDL